MKNYLFVDDESDEEFLVGANTVKEAWQLIEDTGFEAPRYTGCILTDCETECSGLDEY